MNQKLLLIKRVLEHKFYLYTRPELRLWLHKYGLKTSLFVVAALIVLQKDLSIHLDLSAAKTGQVFSPSNPSSDTDKLSPSIAKTVAFQEKSTKENASIWSTIKNNLFFFDKKTDDNLANTYSNMTFKVGDYTNKKLDPKRAAQRKKQLAYVQSFVEASKKEMRKYGIPASITLAQGLIESNCGDSKLATRNNNHFGIKCFSRSCRKGHCSNFTDDSHKDFFRKYKSTGDSYRAHSKLLQGKRYRRLFKLDPKDYKGWAHGLKKAGYATDKRYAEKLIHLIESLQLYQYD